MGLSLGARTPHHCPRARSLRPGRCPGTARRGKPSRRDKPGYGQARADLAVSSAYSFQNPGSGPRYPGKGSGNRMEGMERSPCPGRALSSRGWTALLSSVGPSGDSRSPRAVSGALHSSGAPGILEAPAPRPSRAVEDNETRAKGAAQGHAGGRLGRVPPPRVKACPSLASVLAASPRRGAHWAACQQEGRAGCAPGRPSAVLFPFGQRQGRSRLRPRRPLSPGRQWG